MPGESGATETPRPAAKITPARADALIRLLADDSPRIVAVAREHLAAAFGSARPQLVARSRDPTDPAVQRQARRFLLDMDREDRLARWERWTRGTPEGDEAAAGDLDLETGVFLIGQVEYPDLDVARSTAILDDCARVLGRRISPSASPGSLVSKLNHLLFRELGLQGNRESYHDPENSYIHRVLERKLGIPISLSVVAMLVARRVGFELEGVGLPGHFLLRYHSDRRAVYVDAFNSGRTWTLEDCVRYLQAEGYGFREEFLRRYTTREILNRMLANLLGIFRQREDEERAGRVTRMLEALQ